MLLHVASDTWGVVLPKTCAFGAGLDPGDLQVSGVVMVLIMLMHWAHDSHGVQACSMTLLKVPMGAI